MNRIDIAQAAQRLKTARRVLVLGCSGSGKSTLSARLSVQLGLPHVSMDKAFFWLPGWVVRPKDESDRMVAEAVLAERWIMDGNNPRTLPVRLPRTDLVIWLRPPRLVSLFGVLRRVAGSHGKVRPDMAEGCPEKLPDRAFLRYIWRFETDDAPEIAQEIERHGADVPF